MPEEQEDKNEGRKQPEITDKFPFPEPEMLRKLPPQPHPYRLNRGESITPDLMKIPLTQEEIEAIKRIYDQILRGILDLQPSQYLPSQDIYSQPSQKDPKDPEDKGEK